MPDIEMPSEAKEDDFEVREIEPMPAEVSDDDTGVEEEQEPLPPPPQKKEKLKKEDIFKPKKAPPRKVSIDPQPTLAQGTSGEEPIVPKIEPVKKKRQLSEKQKAALARGRAARAANKKNQKAEGRVAPQPVYEPPAPAPAPVYQAPAQQMNNMFTQEQLQEVIFQGVNQYDTMRKKRKEAKRKTQAAQNHNNKVFNDLNSQMRNNDPWSSAFNF